MVRVRPELAVVGVPMDAPEVAVPEREKLEAVTPVVADPKVKVQLTVDELLAALEDPRFNVRFEAIVSIARMPADPRLVDALVEILNAPELESLFVAAGRGGTTLSVDTAGAVGGLSDVIALSKQAIADAAGITVDDVTIVIEV